MQDMMERALATMRSGQRSGQDTERSSRIPPSIRDGLHGKTVAKHSGQAHTSLRLRSLWQFLHCYICSHDSVDKLLADGLRWFHHIVFHRHTFIRLRSRPFWHILLCNLKRINSKLNQRSMTNGQASTYVSNQSRSIHRLRGLNFHAFNKSWARVYTVV